MVPLGTLRKNLQKQQECRQEDTALMGLPCNAKSIHLLQQITVVALRAFVHTVNELQHNTHQVALRALSDLNQTCTVHPEICWTKKS